MDVDLLVERVRQQAAAKGIDPKRHKERLEDLIAQVIAEQRGETGSAAAPVSRSLASHEVESEPVPITHSPSTPEPVDVPDAALPTLHLPSVRSLPELMSDPTIEEIWINAPDRIFIARGGNSELTALSLTQQEVQDFVERILIKSGRRLDLSSPFVDAQLEDGSRLHVVIPDLVKNWTVNIRRHIAPVRSLNDLVESGTLTQQAADFLRDSVLSGLNILISGGTHTGKTTLTNCLLAALPPKERIITVEEVFELSLHGSDVVQMQCRQSNIEGHGEITLRQLIKESLRMRPSRLVVGEVRGAEAFDLLIAMNSGLPGMCTLHANSARDALAKISALPLLAGSNVTHHFVVPTVASSIDLIVHCELTPEGKRVISEIRAVSGRRDDYVVESEPLFVLEGGQLVRTVGQVPAVSKFERSGLDPLRAS